MAILRRRHLGAEEENARQKIGDLKLTDEDMDELVTESEDEEDEDVRRAKSPTMSRGGREGGAKG